MSKNYKILVPLFGALLTIAFMFQNCARPKSSSNFQSSSTNSDSNNTQNTDPSLNPFDPDDPFSGIGSASEKYSSAKDAGTDLDERVFHIASTSDGGYITTGRRTQNLSDSNTNKVLFQKWSSTGDIVYSVEIGDSYNQRGFKLVEMSDSYLVMGQTYSLTDAEATAADYRSADIFFMKLKKDDGSIIEAARFGARNFDRLRDIHIINRGKSNEAIIAVGYWQKVVESTDQQGNIVANIVGNKQALLMKLNTSLQIQWQKRYNFGGDDMSTDAAEGLDADLNSVTSATSKGIYAAGFVQDTGASKIALVLKFNFSGQLVKASHVSNYIDGVYFNSIEDTGTDLIAAGAMNGTRDGEGFFARIGYNLNASNAHTIGNQASNDYFTGVKTTRSGGFIFSGMTNIKDTTQNDHWVVRIDGSYSLTTGDTRTDKDETFSKVFGTSHEDKQGHETLLVRQDLGYAFAASHRMDASNNKHNPRLLLLNQFGEIPEGCSRSKGNANVQINTFNPLQMADFDLSTDINEVDASFTRLEIWFPASDYYTAFTVNNNQFCTE